MINACASTSAATPAMLKGDDSPLFPPYSLVDPEEYHFLISQLDGVLRLLAEMLEVTPRLKAQITARINSVLDERNRLSRLAAGKI